MSDFKPFARKADIVVQAFNDETLVYDLKTNKAFVLNQTSAIVWRFCDGTKNISEIANQISFQLKDIVTEELVWLSLEQLKKENLLENEMAELSRFDGLSRRELVRKIAFTSLVTLPAVSSLIAPTAINAASFCFPLTNNANENPLGCPCDTISDCRNPNACCGVSGGLEVCVSPDSTPLGSPCRANCECAGAATCPACIGFPRICRIGACPP